MNDNKKEIRRIRLEDLDASLQNILLNRISKDDPTWKKLQDLIDDLYKKTHTEKKNITITINQSDNQTIHVYVPKKIGGIDYTSTFTCLSGTAYEAEVIAENGYKAGTLNVSRSGVFTKNKTINATSATKSNATVTITQSAHQTIHVYTPKKDGGTDHTSTFTCPRGTTYEAEVIAENGYVAGALNVSGNGIINSDMSINANPAIGMATVTIVQSAHQTIHVYTPYKGGTDHTSTFTCPIGTKYEAEVIAANGYIAGTLNVNGGGVINSNMDINATPAAKAQIYVAKGSTPWYYSNWKDKTHVVNVDESTSGQATVTCDGKVTNMNHMFYFCSNLTSLDLSNFDTSKVTDMAYMFNSCRSLTTLDSSNFNTSKVTNMYAMFEYCSSLTSLDLSNFDTSKVKDMGYMFRYCSSLTSIKGMIDLKSCESYVDMFYNCSKLRDVKIKNPPVGFNGAGLSKSQYTLYYDNT